MGDGSFRLGLLSKKGASGWTIGKFLTVAMIVIVLILVLWGISTGGLNKLGKQVGGWADSVLIRFHLKEAPMAKDDVTTFSHVNISIGNDKYLEAGLTSGLDDCTLNFSERSAERALLLFGSDLGDMWLDDEGELERKTLIYGVESRRAGNSYYRYSYELSSWEWAMEDKWGGYGNWQKVYGDQKTKGLLEPIINGLYKKHYREGRNFMTLANLRKVTKRPFEGGMIVFGGLEIVDKTSLDNEWISIEDLVLDDRRELKEDIHFSMRGRVSSFHVYFSWPGNDGIKKITFEEKGLVVNFGIDSPEDGHLLALTPKGNTGTVFYYWERPPKFDWRKPETGDLKGADGKLTPLGTLFNELEGALTFGGNSVMLRGREYYLNLSTRGSEDLIVLTMVYSSTDEFNGEKYGLDYKGNLWIQKSPRSSWVMLGPERYYDERENMRVNKKIKDFLIEICR